MSGVYVAIGSTVAKGLAQKGADDNAAAEMTQEAGQSVAAGIQGAEAQRRRTAYVVSNARAKIAGGGLSTTGTSAQSTVSNIEGQGEYEALTQVYQGADRASELNYRSDQLRTQGSNAVVQGFVGGASMFDKYAGSSFGSGS